MDYVCPTANTKWNLTPIEIPQRTPLELCPSKGGSIGPSMTSEVILHYIKNCVLSMLAFIEIDNKIGL